MPDHRPEGWRMPPGTDLEILGRNRALTEDEIFDKRFLTRIHPGAPDYEKTGPLAL